MIVICFTHVRKVLAKNNQRLVPEIVQIMVFAYILIRILAYRFQNAELMILAVLQNVIVIHIILGVSGAM
jgi:hypothetical protein